VLLSSASSSSTRDNSSNRGVLINCILFKDDRERWKEENGLGGGKIKVTPQHAKQSPSAGRRTALPTIDSAVNATYRPLCYRERPGTCCTEGSVGLWEGVDGSAKSRAHLGSNPEPSSPYRGEEVEINNERKERIKNQARWDDKKQMIRASGVSVCRGGDSNVQGGALAPLCTAFGF
jgi:hypothetical protein